MLNKEHLCYIVNVYIFQEARFLKNEQWDYIIKSLAIQYEMEFVLVNSAWNTVYLWNNTEAAAVRPPLSYSTVFQTIKWVCLCFLFSFVFVCSLEGVPVPLVRQKCCVEQNLHSTFMVCVGRPICTCLEQIRPAAAHGRPIPCWLFMIKICFGKPRSLDPEIYGPFLLALTPLHIYNQHFPFPA